MNEYIETKICQIDDVDFQRMFQELCDCLEFRVEDFRSKKMSFLFQEISKQNGKLTRANCLERILTTKLIKFPSDSVIYKVCLELAKSNNSSSLQAVYNLTVLSIIKKFHKKINPQTKRVTRPVWC